MSNDPHRIEQYLTIDTKLRIVHKDGYLQAVKCLAPPV